MNVKRKRILLAVDGSRQSLEAVRYVSKVFQPHQIEVVLFHVMSTIPEFFYDLGVEHQYRQSNFIIRGWERGLKDSIEKFMRESRQILIDANIPAEVISIKIHKIKTGIARDIIAESTQEYSAVVVGRSGLNKLTNFTLGSVASKLLEKLTHVSVCVVGKKPVPGKILLALDESESAMLAVDLVGTLFDRSAIKVTLFHVVREFNFFQREYKTLFSRGYENEWIKSTGNEIPSVYEKARGNLLKAGFDPESVTIKLVKGVSSRAGAIVQEAKEGANGTIVVGRRGMSKVREFFMGRVSNKVVQLANQYAVWIAS